ncbi:hypothetical protein [Alistipes putredinis]|uniref:hypothetical protein n=1 Tax=Alistipes putredinis TaxID=28117 RepID=UPI003AB250C3
MNFAIIENTTRRTEENAFFPARSSNPSDNGLFPENSNGEKSRNLPRPLSSEKRHRPTPSEHRKMTLHLAGGIFFAIFVKDRRRFGNLRVQIRVIALGFHYFWSRQHGGPA